MAQHGRCPRVLAHALIFDRVVLGVNGIRAHDVRHARAGGFAQEHRRNTALARGHFHINGTSATIVRLTGLALASKPNARLLPQLIAGLPAPGPSRSIFEGLNANQAATHDGMEPEMKDQPRKHTALDSQTITLEMLVLLGRAIVAGIAVSVTAVLFIVAAAAVA